MPLPSNHDVSDECRNKASIQKASQTICIVECGMLFMLNSGSLCDETNFLTTKDSGSVSPSLPTCGRYDLLIDSFSNEYPSRDGETSNDLFDRENVIDKSRYKRTNFLVSCLLL
ncbi:unnamed protein product [Haemonchus placei]|uniref:Uncharacterized protein n=1 Tax=Haemonchus placei TaxID=6290 RepID=A0A0N4VUD6_HAEPC|nr:unnamed protein product [Haemonchus placei]